MLSIGQVLKEQAAFNVGRFIHPDMGDRDKQKLTKDFLVHMLEETHEILREMNWKMHKQNEEHTVDVVAVKFEMIDILKFWGNLALVWGITEDDLDEAFHIKSAIVRGRQAVQEAMPPTGPIVCITHDHPLFIRTVRAAYGYVEANIHVVAERHLTVGEKTVVEFNMLGGQIPIPYKLVENVDLGEVGKRGILLSHIDGVYRIASEHVSAAIHDEDLYHTYVKKALHCYLDAL